MTLREWRQDEGVKALLAESVREAKEEALREGKSIVRSMRAKTLAAMPTAVLETADDVRKWAVDSVKLTRLTEGESTDNLDARVQPVRERTPEEREANHKLLQGDDDDGDT